MPLYEFKCRQCEHNWEVKLAYKAPVPDCPGCGSTDVRKVFHAAALVFKGSGWHVNDYGKSGPRGSSSSQPATTESKAETSPKPATEPATTATGPDH